MNREEIMWAERDVIGLLLIIRESCIKLRQFARIQYPNTSLDSDLRDIVSDIDNAAIKFIKINKKD